MKTCFQDKYGQLNRRYEFLKIKDNIVFKYVKNLPKFSDRIENQEDLIKYCIV